MALSELLVDDAATARRLMRQVLRETHADYAVRIANDLTVRGELPLPGQGPTLVWRDLVETTAPAMELWNLALGDIELF